MPKLSKQHWDSQEYRWHAQLDLRPPPPLQPARAKKETLTCSWREQHVLDVGHCGVVEHHVDVLVAGQLQHLNELRLLPQPAAALHGAAQVDRAVAIAHHHRRRLGVGELVGVAEGLGRGHAAAVQAVDGHAGRLQLGHQRLRVLADLPALGEAHVCEEALVVGRRVVVGGRLDEDLVVVVVRVVC